jgi:monothiol glutaredoxin
MGVTAGLHAEAGMRTVLTSSQVFVKGEFIGGCDTTMEMYKSGELSTMLKAAGAK